MEKVDTVVVGKTGTLTEGRPAVTQIVPATGFEEAELLRLAASVERVSEHPLALAIVEAAKARGLSTSEVGDFDSPTGRGALGTVDGRRIVLRSEEHTSELQSLMRISYAVFCLKNKKKKTKQHIRHTYI